MSKLEDYTTKAAVSRAAADAATNERDRAFHNRSHSIWRKLIANIGEAEERAAMRAPKPVKAPSASGRTDRLSKQDQLVAFTFSKPADR